MQSYQRTGGVILSGVVLLLIGFLTFLTIYQGPSMDDFVGRYYYEKLGYLNGVKAYLTYGNSRYFSLPLFIGASASYFLIEHYYIVLIAGIIFSLACLYYFLKTVVTLLLTAKLSSGTVLFISAFLFLLFCSLVRELPSFVYWFATTLTYLIPFGLFLVFCSMVLYIKNLDLNYSPQNDSKQDLENTSSIAKGSGKGLNFPFVIALVLLKFMIGGSNELILFYSMYFTFLMTVYEFTKNRKLSEITSLLIGIDLVILISVILIPGAASRSHDFSVKQSIAFSITGAAFRVYQLLQHIFSSALFWVVMVFIVWASKFVNPKIKEWVRLSKKTGLLMDLFLVIFPIFFFIFFIRHFGGEVVPPRAENIIICISTLGIYGSVFLWVVKVKNPLEKELFNQNIFLHTFKFALALILLLSPLSYGILQNLLFLPAHKRVLDQRVSIIREAKLKGENSVRIPSYKPMMEQELEKQFGQKGANFFRAEFPIPPSFSYFKDDPNNPSNNYAYAEYYKIDSMIVDTAVVQKWSLTDKLLFGAP